MTDGFDKLAENYAMYREFYNFVKQRNSNLVVEFNAMIKQQDDLLKKAFKSEDCEQCVMCGHSAGIHESIGCTYDLCGCRKFQECDGKHREGDVKNERSL
ncbi:MAG: hypothetical protein HY376_03055 [Candidatus Blackburnbacteria bacterium]|nr:hypothetical protein [Candidatus Blackburnbacteria bacterium]